MTRSRYLVELAAPPGGWETMQELTARARAGADALSARGPRVRFLRSIYVPEDGSCFFLYEAESSQLAGEAARQAELDVLTVGEALNRKEHG